MTEDDADTIEAQVVHLQTTYNKFLTSHNKVLAVTGKQSIDVQHELFAPIMNLYLSTLGRLKRFARLARIRDDDSDQAGPSRTAYGSELGLEQPCRIAGSSAVLRKIRAAQLQHRLYRVAEFFGLIYSAPCTPTPSDRQWKNSTY